MEQIYAKFINSSDRYGGMVGMPLVDNDDYKSKMSEDTYEIFVNDDKVGNKALLTQTDDPEDINKFLEENGFKNFKTNVLGDHIVIETNERPHKMKEILSSYLDIR